MEAPAYGRGATVTGASVKLGCTTDSTVSPAGSAAPHPSSTDAELLLERRGGPQVFAHPNVLLTTGNAAWRCPDAGVDGHGLVELVSWIRDCDILPACLWCFDVRRVERIRSVRRRAAC